MVPTTTLSELSFHIWNTKYRYRRKDHLFDETIEDTWRRVARAAAEVEPADRAAWTQRFYHLLEGFRFLPGGRILAGAGTTRRVTLFNCFVMGQIDDTLEDIFEHLKEGALTMQQGGGVGYDFSTLRPAGTVNHTTGTVASGPISFMHIWDRMCATLLSTGVRRGAMMATLRCDHPDIEAFIDAKRKPGQLANFNLSVLVSDDFMQAVNDDLEWPLVFPDPDEEAPTDTGHLLRPWPGYSRPVVCRIYRKVPARRLWHDLMRATYEHAEPGVLFIDRINRENNLRYREQINATNPCGEVPLPAYGACNLGSINLTRFVRSPFHDYARIDLDEIQEVTRTAVRFLDNIIEASSYPLLLQKRQARGTRRIGLGITGLADALIMLRIHYGDGKARRLAARIMQVIAHAAYRQSVELAKEKGSFPYFKAEEYLKSAYMQRMPDTIRESIRRHGIRNSHLISIAPTGTISLLAQNISSGIEPVYDFQFNRRILNLEGNYDTFHVRDYAYRQWLHSEVRKNGFLPAFFVSATELRPIDHLDMQAALQPYVDSAISKTINVPEDFPFDSFKNLYQEAYRLGLKGCTTFRPNPVTGSILSAEDDNAAQPATHCCNIEREAD